MSQMFRIQEDDLAELERAIPRLADRLTCAENLLDNKLRTNLRRMQTILSNVRWNYGPPSEIEIRPVDDQAS